MSNQEEEKRASASPLVSGFVIISAIFIILALLNSAINTPLVRSFDDAAKRAKISACESEKGYKDTEDCYK